MERVLPPTMAIPVQAVGQQDLQGLLQTCSASFSRWFMAHLPPLLARHPAAAVLARPLDHFGSDQVSYPAPPHTSFPASVQRSGTQNALKRPIPSRSALPL